MLTGKNPLKLPAYDGRQPVECSVRCECGRRYVVLTGAGIVGDAESRARERAEQMRAVFVDARKTPLMNCGQCDAPLDFTTGESVEMVM